MEVQAVMQLIHEEMAYMAQLVGARKLQDSVEDIYGYILNTEGAAPVHSNLVLPSKTDGDAIGDDANSIPQHMLGDAVLGPAWRDHAVLRYVHAPGSRVRCLLPNLCTHSMLHGDGAAAAR